MNTTIGIYDTHQAAIDAAIKLKEGGYPVTQLTIMGLSESEKLDDELHLIPNNPLNVAGLGTGVAVGTTVGVLTGIGIFAIPGLGFLFGAGALVGAIAGFDFGLIGGGIASVLASVGVTNDNAKRYNEELKQGKFLLVAEGTKEEVSNARTLLQGYDMDTDLTTHSAETV